MGIAAENDQVIWETMVNHSKILLIEFLKHYV